MAARNFYTLDERFNGAALGAAWAVADTSVAGAPTKEMHADGYHMAFAADVEAENLCLYLGDVLSFDITKLREVEFQVKMDGTTKDTTTTLAIGVGSARNDTTDSITYNAMLKIVNTSTTLGLVAETDDGTRDIDDVATGAVLSTSFKTLLISFAKGLSDVRFFVDGQPVAEGQVFNMSAATGGVQPFIQIQKTSDSNTDGVKIRRVICRGVV